MGSVEKEGEVSVQKIIVLSPSELQEIISEAVTEALQKFQSSSEERGIPTTDDTKLLTVVEACSLLDVSRPTIMEWSRSGKLTPLRMGRRIYFDKAALLKSLAPTRGKYLAVYVPQKIDGKIGIKKCVYCGNDMPKYYRIMHCTDCLKNPDIKKAISLKKTRDASENVSDAYVAQQIRRPLNGKIKLPISEIPSDLIDLKRESIKIKRIINQNNGK